MNAYQANRERKVHLCSLSLCAGFLKDLELGEDELTKAGVAELHGRQLESLESK